MRDYDPKSAAWHDRRARGVRIVGEALEAFAWGEPQSVAPPDVRDQLAQQLAWIAKEFPTQGSPEESFSALVSAIDAALLFSVQRWTVNRPGEGPDPPLGWVRSHVAFSLGDWLGDNSRVRLPRRPPQTARRDW